MQYIKQSLEKYIEDLGARLPAPGGGSASAACGSLGVALVLMVSNFTLGNEKYAAYEKEIKKIIAEAEKLKKKLLKFIDEDVEAYKKLSAVYKLPKEERDSTLEAASKEALAVPLDICRAAHEAMQLVKSLLEKGNRNLISDVGIAASMIYSAFESAKMNVDINLKQIRDEEFVNKIDKEIMDMGGEVKRSSSLVIKEVCDRLK